MTDLRPASSAPAGYRFPREVIALAVRWYLRYGLSYRDVEELLAERGITVDHVTVYRWVQTLSVGKGHSASAGNSEMPSVTRIMRTSEESARCPANHPQNPASRLSRPSRCRPRRAGRRYSKPRSSATRSTMRLVTS